LLPRPDARVHPSQQPVAGVNGPKLPPTHDKAHYFDVEVAKSVVVHAVQRAFRQGLPAPDYVNDIAPIKKSVSVPPGKLVPAGHEESAERWHSRSRADACGQDDRLCQSWSWHGATSKPRSPTTFYSTTSPRWWMTTVCLCGATRRGAGSLCRLDPGGRRRVCSTCLEKQGTLTFKAHGTVDSQCKAVRSGRVKFNDDGSMDKRCNAYRAIDLSFRAATKDLQWISPRPLQA
ncbi:hypothetical protein As57867_017937, partial [Aphanomyces stellatus]